MTEYIPFPAYPDDAPIDLRFVFENEKPAGKHGFIKAVGDHFEFEDGTVGRFWGTNFNGGANFPDHDYAEKSAKRLAKFGVNIVRFHQLDAEWDTPNIFAFTKGKRIENTRELDPESMDRLDYYIYCLKNEGIYCYMDTYTYRKFKNGDGVENVLGLKDAAKPYCACNRRLIELQKEMFETIWCHVNPYTGLAYKDDPVFVMAEIVNECDFFSWYPFEIEPYSSEFRQNFRAWLDEKGLEYDAENCDLNEKVTGPLLEYKMEVQTEYYREMTEHCRKIGIKIPITGTNWHLSAACTKTHFDSDFIDNHHYVYDWHWGEFDKSCMNRGITQMYDCGSAIFPKSHLDDKPLFISEWDMPWPNSFRAESPIYFAAVGALQGYAGYTIHTYAYGTRLENMKILGKEGSSQTIGGVSYREGIFSTWNDPAKFGLFYHAAIITRRGDVSPAKNKIAVKVDDLISSPGEAFKCSSELSRIVADIDREVSGADRYVKENEVLVPESAGEVRSDTGELYRSWEKNYGTIDTPFTKCVYGFLGKNGELELDGLSVKCENDFAVIAMSSLDGEKISSSKNMLLTTVGRAFNQDAKFADEKMLDYGHAPIMIEVIKSEIKIKTDCPDLRVWSVNSEGFYVGAIPTEYKDGVLSFKLGDNFRSMYYLIQSE
ncbi:MAG: hypothetical protein IKT70_05375 [Clostridia bacterium]|nr:hypothetical protein [Clostridia bacterium]